MHRSKPKQSAGGEQQATSAPPNLSHIKHTVDLKRLPPDQRRAALIQMQRERGNAYVRRRIRAIHGDEIVEVDVLTPEAPQSAPQTTPAAAQHSTDGKPVVQRSIWSGLGKFLGFVKQTEVGAVKVVNSAAQYGAREHKTIADRADTAGDFANFASGPASIAKSVMDHPTDKNPVGGAIKWLGGKISSGASWLGGKISSGAKAVGKGVASGAGWVGDKLSGGAKAAGSWFSQKASALGGWLKGKYEGAKAGWQSFKTGIANTAKAARSGMGQLMEKARNGMSAFKNSLVSKAGQLKGLIGDGLSRMSGVWNSVKSSAASFGRRVMAGLPVRLQNAMQTVGQTASSALKGIGSAVWGGLKTGFSSMASMGKAAKDGIFSAARTLGGGITSLWQRSKGLARSFASGAKSAISTAGSWLGSKAAAMGRGLWGGVKSMFGSAKTALGWTGRMLGKAGGMIAKVAGKVGPWLKAAGPALGKFVKVIPVVGNFVAAGVALYHGASAIHALATGNADEAFSSFKKMTSAAAGVIPVVGTIMAGADLYMLYKGGYNMTDDSGQPVKAGNTVDVIAVWLGHARKHVANAVGGAVRAMQTSAPMLRMKRADVQRASKDGGDPQAIELLTNATSFEGVPIPEETALDDGDKLEHEDNEPDLDAMKEGQAGGAVLEELPEGPSDEDDSAIADDSEDSEPADPDVEQVLEETIAPSPDEIQPDTDDAEPEEHAA